MAEEGRGHHHDVGTDHEPLDHVGPDMDAGGRGERHAGTELRPQDGDPADRQAQLGRLAQLEARHDLQCLEVEVRLVEAVEQHQPSAPAATAAAAKLANAV